MWGASWFKKERGFDRRPMGVSGKRCYAIGDVHGRLDLLTALLGELDADMKRRAAKETWLVFLGDLIDRGPDSHGVIEQLLNTPPAGLALHIIMGNHEEMLLKALAGDGDALSAWLVHGGVACAQSYGVDTTSFFGRSSEDIAQIIAAQIPREHVAFIAGFVDSVQFGDFFLVHAGVRPGVALDQQDPRDLRWIRDAFLRSNFNPGCIIVHGHSISDEVDIRNNRICIDTGAYRTGILTCMAIEDDEIYFLRAVGDRSAP